MGDMHLMELLLAKGANVNIKNNDGWTALRFALTHRYGIQKRW